MDLNIQLEEKRRLVNSTLHKLTQQQGRIDDVIKQAVEYTLNAPGKRIRAAVVMWCCELISGSINSEAKITAAAIEMVHTYSLVHDDLPAMDDDDFRRSQPTCHKAFDEATAILTGDALLTLAFEILAGEIDDATMSVRLIRQLAWAAGPAGMIAGQMTDLKAEEARPTEEILEHIHINKTAKMFQCAAVCGAITANANENQLNILGRYGLKLGLSFQIADDILDVSGSTDQLGKTAGKDQKARKMTYPALMGIEKSRQLERKLTGQAIAALGPFGPKAEPLRKLAQALLQRTK